MPYEFEVGHNTAKTAKNICCAKDDEDAVDHCTVIKRFKIFRSDCKNDDNQARSGSPKTMNSKSVLQTIETKPADNTRRISGELGILQSSKVCYLHDRLPSRLRR